jgi:hypothetical protein
LYPDQRLLQLDENTPAQKDIGPYPEPLLCLHNVPRLPA